jgi:hypothetical protein
MPQAVAYLAIVQSPELSLLSQHAQDYQSQRYADEEHL